MSTRKNYKKYFTPTGGSSRSLFVPRRTRYRISQKGVRRNLDNQHETQNTQEVNGNSPQHEEETNLDDNVVAYNDNSMPGIDDLSSDEEYDDSEEKSQSQPIFPNSQLTANESCLLIFGYAFRHKISKSALSDLLTLINFHLPQGETIPSSVYLLSKKLNPCYDQAKKIPFCSNCQNILETNGSCASCQESGRNATKDGNFFVSFDIATIMKQLLERKNIAQCLKKNFAKRQFNNNESSGIMDGEAYKKLKLSKFDITCCINTDGVSIFNSSKSCIWPLLLSINELDYDLRRKHTILAGLWFNDSKPNFKLFLDPLINQSNQLSKEGIQWNFNGVEIKSKIFFPMLAADSVARAPLQGINQFNGEYSCPWCQAKGLNLSTGDRSHKWIFPPTEIAANRNKEHFLNQLLELRDLLSTGSSISNRYGIKLASPLLKIPHFSIVDGFVFDYMHTVLLGVVRMLTFAWILPKNHQEIFYIGNKENQINQKLRRCKIPKNCSRTIRDLSSIKYWKAHEWKNWMLIAVPLLKGILQDCFLKHFAKLVDSISILCQDSVTMDEILVAEILIKEFSMLIPNLYGQSYCSFNVHLLTHAAENVRKWGPLWGYSLFQFENYNGILKNSFCGTREISTQIVNRAICTQKVYSLGEQHNSKAETDRESDNAFSCAGSI
ncbi:hypothetical protein Fcan01_21926 [Folsomia candida]|uniref:DUF4218 domain-containing protein n=1 Tax=Folsomia candida TaxID=158441 RepID=A0A226DDN0_FOLCA|nr:hypothetical protein Fcan01_21926 [Folsomia candida]